MEMIVVNSKSSCVLILKEKKNKKNKPKEKEHNCEHLQKNCRAKYLGHHPKDLFLLHSANSSRDLQEDSRDREIQPKKYTGGAFK